MFRYVLDWTSKAGLGLRDCKYVNVHFVALLRLFESLNMELPTPL